MATNTGSQQKFQFPCPSADNTLRPAADIQKKTLRKLDSRKDLDSRSIAIYVFAVSDAEEVAAVAALPHP
jgi:hypothetical protein